MGVCGLKRSRDTQLGYRLRLDASCFAEAGVRRNEVASGLV